MNQPSEKYLKEKAEKRAKMYAEGRLPHIRELLERVNRYFPDSECIVDKTDGEWVTRTTAEFYADVKAVGTALLNRGFHKSHIALVGANSYVWLVAYFAIVTTGNITVPLDKELPKEDLERLMTKADAEAVFMAKNQLAKVNVPENITAFGLQGGKEGILGLADLIQEGKTLLSQGDKAYENTVPVAEDIAVIIFTSGTTGANKGVMLSQYNLVYNAEEFLNCIVPMHSALSVLPMNHIFEMGCTVLPMIYCNAVVYINDKLHNFFANIKAFQPEFMAVVPLFADHIYGMLVNKTKQNGTYDAVCEKIKESHALMAQGIDRRKEFFADLLEDFGYMFPHLTCGGAPVNPEKSAFLCELGFDMYIGYGLSETSPVAAVHTHSYSNTASVGFPFSRTQIRIDAPDAGGNGEIWIKGDNVCRGYYKDDNANEVSFEDGWFKTGDYGRIGEENELYITGRKKNLIILDNGKNIYPEEIEYFFINACEQIKEAVVFEWCNPSVGDKKVLAMSVGLGKDGYTEEIAKTLTQTMERENLRLPAYKRVQVFYVSPNEFARTSTKKIIRKKVEEEFEQRIGENDYA